MSADVVIRAERLGKRYMIGHQAKQEAFPTLRDTLARGVRRLGRSALDVARGRTLIGGDVIEAFWALKDVDFEVRRGEVLGVIGRNGAGKSTLLKILSRITEPTSGRLTLSGRVGSLLEVGTGFNPELTGRENIFLNGAILGMGRTEIRRKFDEIVSFAEVETFLDTPVKRYSSGMYVRLAFAVAAHLEPEILIVDEVLAVGDVEFQKKCLGKMGDVAAHGRTILFVSHNMSAVQSLCSRAILLSSGSVVADGAVEPVLEQYLRTGSEESSKCFAPDESRPSICKVEVDERALRSNDLVVDITFSSPEPLHTAVGGVSLRSLTEGFVWGSTCRMDSYPEQARGRRSGTLRCEVKGLPLAPGPYVLSVGLADWYRDYDAKMDVLTVTLGDHVDPLRPPPAVIGHLDWPAVWRDVTEQAADLERTAVAP